MDIDDLLEEWEAAWQQGRFISAEQLCASCPELRSTVQERITDLLAFSRFERSHFSDDLPSSTRRKIGDYLIEAVLGGGGTSVVYRCRRADDGREAAIKVLNVERMSRDGLARFERESKILRRLDHPSIVRILDVGLTDLGIGTQQFIAMELVSGKRLDDFVEQHALPLEHRIDLVVQIGRAVAYLHSQGVIHRDLKPANVIVNDQQRAIVVDFGLACLERPDDGVGRTTDTSMSALGTLPYVSPEQLTGHRAHIDFRTDIYSLGVIAYHLVTGKLPIETRGRSLFDIYQQIQSVEPPRADRVQPEVPRAIALVLAKAMSKHRDDRYRSMDDFTRDLQRALRSERTLARSPSTWHAARRWMERNPRTTRAFALTILILSTAAIVSVYFARNAAVARTEAEQSLHHSILQTELVEERNERLRRVAYNLQLDRLRQLVQTRPAFVIKSLNDKQAFPLDFRSVVWGMTLDHAHQVRHTVPNDRPYTRITNDTYSDWLYLVDDQNRVKVWQLMQKEMVTEIDALIKDSPICSISRSMKREAITIAHANGKVHLYNERNGSPLKAHVHVGEPILNGCFSDDDTYSCVTATGSVRRYSGEGLVESNRLEPRHAAQIASTAYSPLGHVLAVSFMNGKLVTYDFRSDQVRDVDCPPAEDMAILYNDAQLFLIQGTTTRHMFLDREDAARVVNVDREPLIGMSAGGNRKMAYGMANRVVVNYHSRQPHDTSISLEMDRPVRSVSFCQGARFLTSTHPDGTVTIWDTDVYPYRQRPLDFHQPVTLLPLRKSNCLLAGGLEGIVSLISPYSVAIERKWKAHDLPVALLAVNDAETLVATHPRQGNVRVWDLASGEQKAQFRRPIGDVTSIVFLKGDRAVNIATRDGQIFNGTFDRPHAVPMVPFTDTKYVLLTPDGHEAIVALSNGRIEQWQIEPRKLSRVIGTYDHDAQYLALSDDRKRLASVHGSQVLVWKLDKSTSPSRCDTPHTACRHASFSPDSRTLLTLGSEGILAFWDPEIGMQQLAIDDGARSFEAAVVTNDCRYLVTSTITGVIQWWKTYREPHHR